MDALIKHIIDSRVYEAALETPLDFAPILSRSLNNRVFLKREDMQPVFSFKLRGAYNRIANLSPAEKERGVICVSAGNHAQGVAFSARQLHINATIVMPRTTPLIKVAAVKSYGVEVVLAGDHYAEAAAECYARMEKTGQVLIHPFDDPLVIAGQGTIGHELLRQKRDMHAVFVPIGGGGLAAGIAFFLKEMLPSVKVIGVEPIDSNAMQRSLHEGKRVVLDKVGIFADGVAVKQAGELTFDICRRCLHGVITVSTDEMSSAIKSIYEDTRSIMEPAGALAVAGLKKYVQTENTQGQNLVAINSGANMNFDRLQFVAERSHTGDGTEALFAVTIPEQPGALREFCQKFIGQKSISEFNYRLVHNVNKAHIFVGLSAPGSYHRPEQRAQYVRLLRQNGYEAVDLTDDELAKAHIRHMVGGRSQAHDERLFRFQFPERPGALVDFLQAMSEAWNISLFHYRMHGGDFGRVLIGLQIPPETHEAFESFLDKMNYSYFEETQNPAYKLFL